MDTIYRFDTEHLYSTHQAPIPFLHPTPKNTSPTWAHNNGKAFGRWGANLNSIQDGQNMSLNQHLQLHSKKWCFWTKFWQHETFLSYQKTKIFGLTSWRPFLDAVRKALNRGSIQEFESTIGWLAPNNMLVRKKHLHHLKTRKPLLLFWIMQLLLMAIFWMVFRNQTVIPSSVFVAHHLKSETCIPDQSTNTIDPSQPR